MREDCIVFDDNGFHREVFDRVLGKWIPDANWWHPGMENPNVGGRNNANG